MPLPSIAADALHEYLLTSKVNKFASLFEGLVIERHRQMDYLFLAIAHRQHKMVAYLNRHVETNDDEKALLAHHAIIHDNKAAFALFLPSLVPHEERFLAMQLAIDHRRPEMFKHLWQAFPWSVADIQRLTVHAWDKEESVSRQLDLVDRFKRKSSDYSKLLSQHLSDEQVIGAIDLIDDTDLNAHRIHMHVAFMMEHVRPIVHDHAFNKGMRQIQASCARWVTSPKRR